MNFYNRIIDTIKKLKDLPPLLFRLVLAYGFYGPATMKLKNFNGIVEWFTGMGMPLPKLNALIATGTETAGFILLFLGLATRLITIPLMIVMLVAIFAVHFSNGFAVGDNGFEIPLYYLIMLFSLLVTGPGKFSLDTLVQNKSKKNNGSIYGG